MSSLLMVAGEVSGDLHAARLLSELRRRLPSLDAFGMGGSELEAAGLERIANSAEISVVGITEVLKIYSRAKQLFSELLAEVDRRRPALAVLVDFPEFNLRLAKQLKQRGVPVVYYISPQVWAWRRHRVKGIARVVDKMLVLFPFEVDFYHGHQVRAVHVGHPLVDEVPRLPHVWDCPHEAGQPFRLALLPGSRRSEVTALLPAMLEAVAEIDRRLPIEVELVRAPSLARRFLDEILDDHADLLTGCSLRQISGDRFEHLSQAHLALCASGTATLELGLLGTPMVVLYRLNPWSYLLARLLVRLPHFSLVNLVLGEAVVPELFQSDVQPTAVAEEVERLLREPERAREMRASLATLRDRLGQGGASRRAADEIVGMLGDETGH
jgi:lipid-A-disaccharide synthase